MPILDEVFANIKTIFQAPHLLGESFSKLHTQLNSIPNSVVELLERIENLFSIDKHALHQDWQKLNSQEILLKLWLSSPGNLMDMHMELTLLSKDWETSIQFGKRTLSIASLILQIPKTRKLLINDPKFQEKFLQANWDSAEHEGPAAGKSISWSMLTYSDIIELLLANSKFQEKFLQSNWDATAQDGPDAGISIVWMATLVLRKLIMANPKFQEKLLRANWDVAAQNGKTAGQSVAWLMLRTKETCDLLTANPQFQEKLLQANWDAVAQNGEDAGRSVAWIMLLAKNTRKLLLDHPKFQEKLLQSNWDATAQNGEDAGMSVAWVLLWKDNLLISSPKFQEKLLQSNWDAAAKNGVEAGKSIAWLMLTADHTIALLNANLKFQEKLLQSNWDAAAQNGEVAGRSVAWLMAQAKNTRKLLLDHPEFQEKLLQSNWDATAQNGEDAGMSVAWVLLWKKDTYKLLISNPKFQEKLLQANWDTAAQNGVAKGKSIAWSMIHLQSTSELITTNSKFQGKFIQTNWDAAPQIGVEAGKSIAWLMLTADHTIALLNVNLKFQEKFLQSNWNVAPQNDSHAGKSIAWLMLIFPIHKLLIDNLKFQEKFLLSNWDATAQNGPAAGKSVAWLMFSGREKLSLLTDNPRFQEKLLQANWDASAQNGEEAGWSLAWLFVMLDTKKLLITNQKFQEKILQANWGASPQQGPDTGKNIAWKLVTALKANDFNLSDWFVLNSKARKRLEEFLHGVVASKPSKTILYRLAKSIQGRKIIHITPTLLFSYYKHCSLEIYSPLAQFVTANDQELITGALLLQANYLRQEITIENQTKLALKHQQIKQIIHAMISGWENNRKMKVLPELPMEEICSIMLLSELPECRFIIPNISKIIQLYLGYPLPTKLDELADLLVHHYRAHHTDMVVTKELHIIFINTIRRALCELQKPFSEALLEDITIRRKLIDDLVTQPTLDAVVIRRVLVKEQTEFKAARAFLFAGNGNRLTDAGESVTLRGQQVRERRIQFFTYSQPIASIDGAVPESLGNKRKLSDGQDPGEKRLKL